MNDRLDDHLRAYAASRETRADGAPRDPGAQLRVVVGRVRRRRLVRAGGTSTLVVAVATGGVLGASALDARPGPATRLAPAVTHDAATTSPTPAPTQEPTTEDGLPEDPLGPLEKVMARADELYGDEGMLAEERAQQEVVARCMADAGFTYVPFVDESGPWTPPGPEAGTLEYAERYGYGIAFPDAPDNPERMVSGPRPVDPNRAVVETLDEGEQAAYAVALNGPESTVSDLAADTDGPLFGDMTGPTDWSRRGCIGKAMIEVPFTFAVVEEQFPELSVALGQVGELEYGDPRMDELDRDWAACMASAGYPGLRTQMDAHDLADEPYQAARAKAVEAIDGGPELLFERSPAGEAAWAAFDEALEKHAAPLRAAERELAVADVTCVQEVRYEERQRAISWELQQELLDARRDEIERWVAAHDR